MSSEEKEEPRAQVAKAAEEIADEDEQDDTERAETPTEQRSEGIKKTAGDQ